MHSSLIPHRAHAHPCGSVVVLAALCLCLVIAFLALSVDIGHIAVSKAAAQNSADAAALAAAQELYPDPHPQTAIKLPLALPIYKPVLPEQDLEPAIASAQQLAAKNRVADVTSPSLLRDDLRFSIDDGGIMVGPPSTIDQVDSLLDLLQLRTSDHGFVNSVQATVRLDEQTNGCLKLFFAPALGTSNTRVAARSSATVLRGYGVATGDKVLPLAMDITIWNAIRFTNGEVNALDLTPLGIDVDLLSLDQLLGGTSLLGLLGGLTQSLPVDLLGSPIHVLDDAKWERGMTTVTQAPDGVWEVLLLADQLRIIKKTGLLGQLLSTVERVPSMVVTLDIPRSGRSTPNATLLNQIIINGLSQSDIQSLTTTSDQRVWLPFEAKGFFELPDECEASLRSIIGQPRILPLYATLPGTVQKVTDALGASHTFKFVGWGAVVVTDVNLTGPIRYLKLQPAIYSRYSVCGATGTEAWRSSNNMSDGVYTSPRLVK